MSKLITAAALAAAYNAKYPVQAGTLESVSASEGTLGTVEAAGLRPFSAGSGKLVVIKATDHFFVAGEVVPAGDLVEVAERDARQIIVSGRGVEATEDEIAAAKKPSKS